MDGVEKQRRGCAWKGRERRGLAVDVMRRRRSGDGGKLVMVRDGGK